MKNPSNQVVPWVVSFLLTGGAFADQPQALETAKQDPASLVHASALRAIEAGQQDEARKLLQILLRDHPDNPDYRYDLARAQKLAGQTADAALNLERVLELQPHRTDARILLAHVYSEQAAWPRVIRLLGPLVDTSPNYENAKLLAQAHENLGELSDAAWYYETTVRLNSDSLEDVVHLAHLHTELNTPTLAIRVLEDSLELHPNNAKLHYLLARAYLHAGRPLGRIQTVPLSDAIPESTNGKWYVLGEIPDQAERYRVVDERSAIYHLQKAIQLGFDAPDLNVLHADIWFEAGHYQRARDLYETMEHEVPTELLADYHFRYAKTLYWLEDLEGFENHANKAVELNPDKYKPQRLEIYTLLAESFCLRGDLDRYLEYLRLAVEEAPRTADLRYRFGNALFEANRKEEAVAQWQAVLQIDPDFPERARILEKIDAFKSALPKS